uniref:UMOD/GP2/OIT3-like D8C domain-containing protein n=1 Tax=Astyanax mexicanus TaxID=7994 RepID=A0A3B1J5K9_ASTMX
MNGGCCGWSVSIRVKACPGNYYVYEFITTHLQTSCSFRPWRSTTLGSWSNCDSNFNWNGWYRLLYYGMNIRMPESCTNYGRCGTSITFWLNGSHPQISDGIISRQACGSWTRGCCEFYVSIQVKACPGNYYVYEFINPNFCNGWALKRLRGKVVYKPHLHSQLRAAEAAK